MDVQDLYNIVLQLISNSKDGGELPVLETLGSNKSLIVFDPADGKLKTIPKSAITFTGEPPSKLTDLTDTPSTKLGQKGKILVVKEDETGFEYQVLAEVTGVTQSELDAAIAQANAYAESLVDPTIDHTYADIATMIANQNSQLEDDIIKVTDASGDPDITSGKAYYFYDGTIAGTIDDYTLLTSEEVKALTSQNIIDALGYTPEKKRTRKEIPNTSQYTVIAADFTDFELVFTGDTAGAEIDVIINTGVCPNTEPSTGLQIKSIANHKLVFTGAAAITPQPGATLTLANDGTSVAIAGILPTVDVNTFGSFGNFESDGTGGGGQTYSVFTDTEDGLVPAPGASSYTGTLTSPTEGFTVTEGDILVVDGTLQGTASAGGKKVLKSTGWEDDVTPSEHEINGVRLTQDISGTFAFDWNAYSQFVLNPTADVTLSHTNLPADPDTKVISGVFRASASVVTFPANTILVGDSLSATVDTKFTVEPISATEIIFTLENLPA